MEKIRVLEAIMKALLSFKKELIILVLAISVSLFIPYSKAWYFISSVIAISVISIIILVAWEYLKPENDEHPNMLK